ncbi:MAG: hypothetical protein R3Y11_09470 [Pseudomonadota bacterium]
MPAALTIDDDALATYIDSNADAATQKNYLDDIKEELSVLIGAAERLTNMVRLESIRIPKDFAAVAAELRPNAKHPLAAGNEPLILPIAGKTGWIFLVHAKLFGPEFDAHIRHTLYWHELTRLTHKMQFPTLRRGQKPNRNSILLGELYRAFGEYDAARKAFAWRDGLLKEHLHEQLSKLAREDFVSSLHGQAQIALADQHEAYPASLNFVLKESGDVRGFLSAMRPFITHRTVALSLAWAAMDHDPALSLEAARKLSALPQEARPLLGLFRKHHVSGNADLTEDIDILGNLWKVWGLHIVDTSSGITVEPQIPQDESQDSPEKDQVNV